MDLPLYGDVIHLQKGQFLTSLKSDSERTGLTVSAIRHARNVLENDNMLAFENNTKFSIVEVCKYKDFQADEEQVAAQPATRGTTRRVATDNNKEKIIKNKKEDNKKGRLSLESWVFAVRMKSKEFGYKVKKEEIIDFYNDGLNPDEALERLVCS